MEGLPPVAKTVYTNCKKCAAERYHVVIAHKTSTSAKVQCEVCGSSKTFSLSKAEKPKSSKAPAAPRSTKASRLEESRRSSHAAEYESLLQKHETPTHSYSIKNKFEVHHRLQHPKFGLGFIRNVQSDRIEVVFPDEVRNLVHNRS